MKRLLAATCAAALLTCSLTACTMTTSSDKTGTGTNSDASYNTNGTADHGTGNNTTAGTNNGTGGTGTNSNANTIDGTGNNFTNNGVNQSTTNKLRYPNGADQDRASYNRMRASQNLYGNNSEGKYTAYSDGRVSDRGSTGSLTQDSKNLGRNVVDGTRNIVNDVNNAIHDLGGVPRADDMPRK